MSAKITFKAVVPARYASTRLPGKPLLDLGGKPMVVRVAERAARSGAEEIWVATDHPDVLHASHFRTEGTAIGYTLSRQCIHWRPPPSPPGGRATFPSAPSSAPPPAYP